MRNLIVYRSLLLPHSETFIREQVLAYRRWHAILVGRRLTNQLALNGLKVEALETPNPGALTRVYYKVQRTLRSAPNISRLSAHNPQLLHAHFGMDAVEAAPIARNLGVPMVVTLHGFDVNIWKEWWTSGKGGLFMRRYPHHLMRLGSDPRVFFIAVSDAIRQRAISYGLPESKIAVRYIGVDATGFRPGPVPVARRVKRVLFVGRLVEKKGCEYLLRAMPAIRSQVPDAELTIVGDGPLRPALEALGRELGVNAIFKGVLSPAEVKNELDAARVFCLPSITAANGDAEGLAIVLLEAQAKGVPVVTSARGGRSEGIVHGETGFAFAERDTRELANALAKILSDDGLAESMAAAGPLLISQRFDINRCTEHLESYYDEVVTRADPRQADTSIPAAP
jgi:glycosyltransferase involved in cell wall biosynthesis